METNKCVEGGEKCFTKVKIKMTLGWHRHHKTWCHFLPTFANIQKTNGATLCHGAISLLVATILCSSFGITQAHHFFTLPNSLLDILCWYLIPPHVIQPKTTLQHLHKVILQVMKGFSFRNGLSTTNSFQLLQFQSF